MDRQICVACGRKQATGIKSCECGHVMREDIAIIANENTTKGSLRLRGKRSMASMDESSIDVFLDGFLYDDNKRDCTEESLHSRRPVNKKQRNKKHRSAGLQFKASNFFSTAAEETAKQQQGTTATGNRTVPLPTAGDADEGFSYGCAQARLQNVEGLSDSLYPTALEDINQKLLRQNRINRMAYI